MQQGVMLSFVPTDYQRVNEWVVEGGWIALSPSASVSCRANRLRSRHNLMNKIHAVKSIQQLGIGSSFASEVMVTVLSSLSRG